MPLTEHHFTVRKCKTHERWQIKRFPNGYWRFQMPTSKGDMPHGSNIKFCSCFPEVILWHLYPVGHGKWPIWFMCSWTWHKLTLFLHCPHSVLQHLLSSLGSHLLPIIYHFPRTWLMFYLVISYILIAFWCFLFNLSKATFCSQCYLILPRDIFFPSQNVMTLLLLICYLELTVVHSLWSPIHVYPFCKLQISESSS